MDLGTALDASGTVSVVGAGGKKSTLYALAARADRAIVTATVRIPIFDDHVAMVAVTPDPVAALESAGEGDWPLGLVPEQERSDRYRGYDPTVVDDISAAHESGPVLVKADGARTRLLKAPGENEPVIPGSTDTVIPIASARVVGKPLTDEYVHRVDRVADLTGRAVGEALTAADVSAVLASEAGGLRGVPDGATAVPLVNMVDDETLSTTGRAIARGILDRCDVPRVVLASMTAADPVVDVLERE